MLRRALPLVFVALASLALHCSAGALPTLIAKAPEFAPADQATCGVVKSPQKPLIVEWPAMDRVTLEAKAKEGVIAVSYVGCKMEVLTNCRAPVKYAYTPTTLKRDAVHLRDADELYSTLPLGAARLEATMERSGELEVDMTIVGRYASSTGSFSRASMIGPDCGRATHVITGLEVGAFDFKAVSDGKVGASAKALFGAGLGVKSAAHEDKLAEDGDDASCAKGTASDAAPPAGCGAVLRVEVTPLGSSRVDCPAGTALQDDRCIALVNLTCPSGLHFDEGAGGCIPSLAPCPRGTTLRGDECVRLVATGPERAPVRLASDEPSSPPVAASPSAPVYRVLLSARTPVRDDAIPAGEELFLSGDYSAAAAYFRTACDRGSAFSCSAAGRMLAEGRGVARDLAAGKTLLWRGCHAGDAWGCSLLEAIPRRQGAEEVVESN